MNPAIPWTLVLRADGVVDLVDGGAPQSWIGNPLAELLDAPPALTLAARELLALPPAATGLRTRHVEMNHDGHAWTCELILLEGLPLRRSLINVDSLLLRTLDTFVTQARSSAVDMRLERAKNLPPVLFVDGEKIAWALATLVGNSLRAFGDKPDRAHITLATTWDDATRELTLAVRDNGRGMTEAQVRWLFERDPSTGRSAGLALAMVRDVIAAHRGRVHAESQLGVGTTITLHLPRLHP